jgi:predicted DNA-binding transcriptional regulator AlpA
MLKKEELIALETKRIAEKFNKEYLDCKDLIQATGLGRDNVRQMMNSKDFPLLTIGKRQVVSILNFVVWQIEEKSQRRGDDYDKKEQ